MLPNTNINNTPNNYNTLKGQILVRKVRKFKDNYKKGFYMENIERFQKG